MVTIPLVSRAKDAFKHLASGGIPSVLLHTENRTLTCAVYVQSEEAIQGHRLLGYKTQFVLHRKHITSPLQSPAS
jgi:hypothetical protein